MKLQHIVIALFFLLIISGISSGATDEDLLADFEMQGTPAAPALFVLQQKTDGSNQLVEDVPDVYPAAVPYFLEYLKENIEEIKDMKGDAAAAIAIAYGYPDNLEINLLSDKAEKITRKIRPDEKLHKLRIRSALVVFNFLEKEEGSSNVAVGFQLFPDDLDYTGMDIKPDYELKRGSWAIIWEHSVRIYTKIYRKVMIDNTPTALIVQTITTAVQRIRAQARISIIGKGGRILRTIQITKWYEWVTAQRSETLVIPRKEKHVETVVVPTKRKYLCKCALNPPPASPVDADPCARNFYRTKGQTCAQFGDPTCPCSDAN
jgi:hypothetical protein